MVSPMTADTLMLARLLSQAALLAATTEYAEMIKRRVTLRVKARERSALEQHGLHGLVRVFLAEAPSGDEPFPIAHGG